MKPKLNDLIRRKDVLAVLEEVFDQYRMSWGEQHGGFAAAVPTAIKNIPTAYDPDKVAKEVREVADRILNYCEEIDWHIPEEERTGYEMLPDIWKLSEIVKKGGVADE